MTLIDEFFIDHDLDMKRLLGRLVLYVAEPFPMTDAECRGQFPRETAGTRHGSLIPLGVGFGVRIWHENDMATRRMRRNSRIVI